MSKVERIERRIQNYRQELQKLKLQLKIAKLEDASKHQESDANQEQQAKQEDNCA